MAFEQKTNHAMEIAGNCLYLQFHRAHTGLAVVGAVSCWGLHPLLSVAQRMEQIRASDLRAPVVSARR